MPYLESKYEYEQTMEDEGFHLGLSASLINWGSGSNWRRCLPTKPAAENLSMHCNATHHIWNRGGERGGCIFTFHSCVFVIFVKYHKYKCTCGGTNTECTAMQFFTFGTGGGREVVYCSFCICVLVYLCIFAYYVI